MLTINFNLSSYTIHTPEGVRHASSNRNVEDRLNWITEVSAGENVEPGQQREDQLQCDCGTSGSSTGLHRLQATVNGNEFFG